jgi:hypothetical protein
LPELSRSVLKAPAMHWHLVRQRCEHLVVISAGSFRNRLRLSYCLSLAPCGKQLISALHAKGASDRTSLSNLNNNFNISHTSSQGHYVCVALMILLHESITIDYFSTILAEQNVKPCYCSLYLSSNVASAVTYKLTLIDYKVTPHYCCEKYSLKSPPTAAAPPS